MRQRPQASNTKGCGDQALRPRRQASGPGCVRTEGGPFGHALGPGSAQGSPFTPRMPSALTCSRELEVSFGDLRTGRLSSPLPASPAPGPAELPARCRGGRLLPAQDDAGPRPAGLRAGREAGAEAPRLFSAWASRLPLTCWVGLCGAAQNCTCGLGRRQGCESSGKARERLAQNGPVGCFLVGRGHLLTGGPPCAPGTQMSHVLSRGGATVFTLQHFSKLHTRVLCARWHVRTVPCTFQRSSRNKGKMAALTPVFPAGLPGARRLTDAGRGHADDLGAFFFTASVACCFRTLNLRKRQNKVIGGRGYRSF